MSHLQAIFFAFILLRFSSSDLQQLDQSFTSSNIAKNQWQFLFKNGVYWDDNGFQNSYPCSTNSLQFIYLYQDSKAIKEYQWSGFQYQIILDIYFSNFSSSNPSYISINFYNYAHNVNTQIYSKLYSSSASTQQSARICKSQAFPFNFETIVLNIPQSTNQFNLQLISGTSSYYNVIYLRNLIIYANPCFSRCFTCGGQAENQCLTCHYGTLLAGKCICDQNHKFAQQGYACLDECPRNYFLANSDLICIPDRRITVYQKYFYPGWSFSSTSLNASPFIFIADPLNPLVRDLLIYSDYYSQNFLGEFYFNEGVSFQLPTINALKFIRLRLTFLFKNIQTNSNIYIKFDNVQQSKIYKTTVGYHYQNAINIATNYYQSETYLRIETILFTNSLNPLLVIQGQLQNHQEYWALYNLFIDIGKCRENCLVCQNFQFCQECESGYQLYQNECLKKCPIYSQNCVDYSEEYLYSRYLAKGFYNINMTLDEVNFYYDSVTNEQTNFKTGQKFGFFPDKFVLGGLLVWFNASYIKTFTILQPHYAISIRFNFTFGDQYPGNFYYIINGDVQGPFNISEKAENQSTQYSVTNIIGQSLSENTTYFYQYLNPYFQNTLELKFQCEAPSLFDIRDGFCAITEYFIVVHYCPPFCNECTSANAGDCSSWEIGHIDSSCPIGQFLQFDTQAQVYSCQTCTQPGCQICDSSDICTSCSNNMNKYFYLQNGKCQCTPFTYSQQCDACNKYCEYCYGPNIDNCLSCISTFQRFLSGNMCICQQGYYDDGVNLPCLPICGDKIIVKGEDCDDGNFNPFDGCHQCKFSCSENCDLCIFGLCESCRLAYQLIQNQCFPICHNNLSIPFQQCEAIDGTTNEKCVTCNYCSPYCIDCRFGVCLKCNEALGWYLQENNSCQPICGDGIIAKSFEDCDTKLQCFQCQSQCGLNCLVCNYGLCVQCQIGYYLILNLCTPICGDNLVVQNEDCDDHNNSKYDGCYKCKLSCQSSCTWCSNQGCQECNTKGWYLNQNQKKCETQCGDGIVVYGEEECDDPNVDTCEYCKIKCQLSCLICQLGKCKKCKDGWSLNILEEYCYTISGDYLVLGTEQCDDGNYIVYDGCYENKFQCQQECKICINGFCMQCSKGSNINGKCLQSVSNKYYVSIFEQYYQNNQCPQFCQICVEGLCLLCNPLSGYGFLNKQNNKCEQICGDMIITQDEECEDGNQLDYDGCFKCKYQCPYQCKNCLNGKCLQCNIGYQYNEKSNKCMSVCGDKVVSSDEDCDDDNQTCIDCRYTCNEHCISCVNGQCQKCKGIGWILNQQTNVCETICGDGIVAGNEQCDDKNYIPEDGCYQCFYECQSVCNNCYNGICLECDQASGWKIGPNEIECIPICGDDLIVGQEDCEDGNVIPYDGCFNCQFQCEKVCIDCQNGICKKCEKGWNIDESNQCYPICGDGYLIQEYEQCDDGNQEQFDGCYECKYQCEKECILCEQGICYECNPIGWQILNINCFPICGDTLVRGDEQCDDGNYNNNDGCDNNCQFKCDQFCTNCVNGICYECPIGRQLNSNNICQNLCGDGIFISEVEKCDDGNNEKYDGCDSSCSIETNWSCYNIEGSISQCVFTESPSIKLTLTSSNPSNNQIVNLTFTQQMKLYSQINHTTNCIHATLLNTSSELYSINITQGNQIFLKTATDIYFILTINIFSSLINPQLQVSIINNTIVSLYDQSPYDKKSLTLATAIILSQTEQDYAASAQRFNQGVFFALFGLSSFCILTGSSDPFWNMMDQLQYLSYIKYINIEFPSNLNIYYEVFKLVTVAPIIKALKIDQFFALLDGEDEYYIETENKFIKDEINAYFLINFQSFIVCIISGFIFFWIVKYLHLFLYRIRPRYLCRFNFTLSNFFYKLRRKAKQDYKLFFYNGVLRVLMSNWYDLSFASAIQLKFNQLDNYKLILNYYMALFVFVMQLIIPLLISEIIYKFQKNNTLANRIQYDALFDELKSSSNTWIMQYNTLLLLKKQIFIVLIIFMQQTGELQTLLIACFQTIYLTYLIYFKPQKKQFEYYKCVVTESLIIFNTLTFLLYKFQKQISADLIIQLGWLHIFTTSIILGFSLLLDFIDQVKKLVLKFSKTEKVDDVKSNTEIRVKDQVEKLKLFF